MEFHYLKDIYIYKRRIFIAQYGTLIDPLIYAQKAPFPCSESPFSMLRKHAQKAPFYDQKATPMHSKSSVCMEEMDMCMTVVID